VTEERLNELADFAEHEDAWPHAEAIRELVNAVRAERGRRTNGGLDLDRVRTLVLEARCPRCLGNGIVGRMGVGHDTCPDCRGRGERTGHGYNLVAALSDVLAELRASRAP
jgi:hypothetical protein